jgi:ubiquinone/menaquinone biosynthesis C-methylase UbiE
MKIDYCQEPMMNIETLSKTKIGKVALRGLGAVMESPIRYRFWSPERILSGADIHPGQSILEIGCGTGYFTLPAAKMIGDQGHLVAIDILSESVEFVSNKVQAAELKNVRVLKADALNIGMDAESFDMVLLFGVIPAPMLPMSQLMAELQRVLKVEGKLAVWPPVPGLLLRAILNTSLFKLTGKLNGVYNFNRI